MVWVWLGVNVLGGPETWLIVRRRLWTSCCVAVEISIGRKALVCRMLWRWRTSRVLI